MAAPVRASSEHSEVPGNQQTVLVWICPVVSFREMHLLCCHPTSSLSYQGMKEVLPVSDAIANRKDTFSLIDILKIIVMFSRWIYFHL